MKVTSSDLVSPSEPVSSASLNFCSVENHKCVAVNNTVAISTNSSY